MARLGLVYAVAFAVASLVGSALAQDYRERLPQDEVIYFLLPDRFENGDPANDRGGLRGGRLQTGFDPVAKGFFHGGDLQGVLARLDYIQQLGATALWLAPIFTNKPVQGAPGHETAGYHGYWITDFTRVDPHFGTGDDLRALVDAAHKRGLKVYLDIVVNHTADVIFYRECTARACPYRSRADFPYTTHQGVHGESINPGFEGDDAPHQTPQNFARLTRSDYAYTPYIPRGQEHIKVPDWLNDPIYYHNRGNTTFEGESSEGGDFAGLDDLMTENPRVVQGFIDIYGAWIDRYRVDGFRIDTAKHVNPEFWQEFVPAMLARARSQGIANFHIFGEVSTGVVDVALLARHTRLHGLPAVLDFAFAAAVRDTVAGSHGTDVLARLFADDILYEGGADTALQLPTFVSNHDNGRFAHWVRAARPGVTDDEVVKRVLLAHAMLLTLRGVPVVYYGDEQGFVGTGVDQDARQDMFATQVPEYKQDRPLAAAVGAAGGAADRAAVGAVDGAADRTADAAAGAHFDRRHPLYRAFAELAALRRSQPALRRGRQITRSYGPEPGLFAVSRIDPGTGRELLLAFNTSTAPLSAQVQVNAGSRHFSSLHGQCETDVTVTGSYRVALGPLDYVLCASADGE
jgi:glycosidase